MLNRRTQSKKNLKQMLNWKSWDGTSALTEGNWYLTGDVTASAVTAEGKVNLDLAGKKLSGELTVTGDVNLVDNTTGGQLIQSNAKYTRENLTRRTIDAINTLSDLTCDALRFPHFVSRVNRIQ